VEETGLDPTGIADSSLFLTGTPTGVRDLLERRRQATGPSYYPIYEPTDQQIEASAEAVVGPLTGN